jgi:hypothetical protein
MGKRKALYLGHKGVDRNRRAVACEGRDQRAQPADLGGGGNRPGVNVARGSSDINDMCAGRHERPCLGECCYRVEKLPSIRKRVFSNVDNSEYRGARGHSTRHGSTHLCTLEYRTDAIHIRKHIELFDPHSHPLDSRIGKAGAADPLCKALAQVDMP